jgi:hypothetical protein
MKKVQSPLRLRPAASRAAPRRYAREVGGKSKKQRLTDDIEEVMARNEFVELDL